MRLSIIDKQQNTNCAMKPRPQILTLLSFYVSAVYMVLAEDALTGNDLTDCTDVSRSQTKTTTMMKRTILMSTDDAIESGERITHADSGLHLDLTDDGTLELWKDVHNASTGFATTSVLLWNNRDDIDANLLSTNYTYRAVMQNDGNFVIFGLDQVTTQRVSDANSWMSLSGGVIGPSYSLVVEEKDEDIATNCFDDNVNVSNEIGMPRLSIIRGPPLLENPDRIWSVEIADVELAAGTSLPDETPLLSESTSDSNNSCTDELATILMRSGDFLYPGKRIVDYGRGVYMYQTMIGTVQIKAGTPERPGDLLWESDYAGPGDDGSSYYTKLEASSNLVTWKADLFQGFQPVWESGTYRPTDAAYYLVVDCYEFQNRIAIYQGNPHNSDTSAVVWMADAVLGENTNIQPVPQPTAPPTYAPSEQQSLIPPGSENAPSTGNVSPGGDHETQTSSASPTGTQACGLFVAVVLSVALI